MTKKVHRLHWENYYESELVSIVWKCVCVCNLFVPCVNNASIMLPLFLSFFLCVCVRACEIALALAVLSCPFLSVLCPRGVFSAHQRIFVCVRLLQRRVFSAAGIATTEPTLVWVLNIFSCSLNITFLLLAHLNQPVFAFTYNEVVNESQAILKDISVSRVKLFNNGLLQLLCRSLEMFEALRKKQLREAPN